MLLKVQFFFCNTNRRMRKRSVIKYATHVMNILKYKINESIIIRNGEAKKKYQRFIIGLFSFIIYFH